jgi:predicted ATPase/DNA-binding SARP family transcriptional activator
MHRFYLFGHPRFEVDGRPIQVSRKKSIAVLAYLASTGQPHSREMLAALCYPEFDQVSARNNLRRDLFELKSAIGEGLLLLEREQVRMMPQATPWVDVIEFRAQVETARQHRHLEAGRQPDPLCASCQNGLSKAVGLYAADFLSGFSLPGSRQFEEWQFFEADSLRQQLAEALQLLINWHRDRVEYEMSILYARRWLSLDPFHEPAHRQLMRLFAWAGQHAAALRQYEDCVRLMRKELKVEPDEETKALYSAIRSRSFASLVTDELKQPIVVAKTADQANAPHNLLPMDAPMAGRDGEVERITRSLKDDPKCRLLTLMGPGGVGKTRLAIETAQRLADDPDCPFYDGIWYISLAPLPTATSFIQPIADALQLNLVPDPAQRLQQLFDYLHPRRLLMILDNFEQLVSDQNIQRLADLLAHAPQVKALVTSRTRLNAHDEQVVPLSGLDIPRLEADLQDQSIEQIMTGYSAIRLFSQRARRLQPDFEITPSNLKPVVQICQVVEGMPLAIELAAAWLEVLSPAEILNEINQCLDFLEVEWPDVPDRHRSLRAVFDSSWKLLDEPEQETLMSLTVFPGSFSRPVARAVSGASIHLLLALQNKSWLEYHNGRYQIHELLCQYAAEKLQADPDAWITAKEHYYAYYAEFLEAQAGNLKGRMQKESFEAIAIEFENIRLAWQWAVENGQVEIAVDRMLLALFRFAEIRAKPFELNLLIDNALQALDKMGASPGRARRQAILLTARASFSIYGYPIRYTDFVTLVDQEGFRQAWEITGTMDRLQEMDFWGIPLAFLYGNFVEVKQGVAYLSELAGYFREQKYNWELAYCLYISGWFILSNWRNLRNSAPSLDDVRAILQEAMEIFQGMGDPSGIGCTMASLGLLYYIQGNYEAAIEQWQTTQANLREVSDWVLENNTTYWIAGAYYQMGDFEAMFRNIQAGVQALVENGDRMGAAVSLSSESLHALRFSTLEHARHTRQQSLHIYQELGHEPGTAWAHWEMGEICRVGGDLVGAQEWNEKAKALFEKIKDRTTGIFYYRLLGDIAQASGDFSAAKQNFKESLLQSRDSGHEWAQVYALCRLGRAEVALFELEAAQEHFSQGLLLAREINDIELALICTAGFASLYAALDSSERAVELGSLVINHKLCWNETKAQATELLKSIKSLTPEQYASAEQRGRSLDVEETFKRLSGNTQSI